MSDTRQHAHDLNDDSAAIWQALAANDETLWLHRREASSHNYAVALGNRGLLLHELADLPGEDRRARLLQALEAYDEALPFFKPDVALPEYIATQNNRGLVLEALADQPHEDRRARLAQALSAYTEALDYQQPMAATPDYAATQASRAGVLSSLADLPGPNRQTYLLESLAAYNAVLQTYDPDTTPFEYAAVQNNCSYVLRNLADLANEDRRDRLGQALQYALSALSIFQRSDQTQFAQTMANAVGKICVQAGDLFPALWNDLGVGAPPHWLLDYLQWQPVPPVLRKAVVLFAKLRKQADAEDTLPAWQRVIATGQQIVQQSNDNLPDSIRQLRVNVADAWHNLGFQFYKSQRPAEARAAFGEAIRLQPDVPHWYCDRTTVSIRLGDFEAAAADLACAADLDPAQPRLEKLHRDLYEARLQTEAARPMTH